MNVQIKDAAALRRVSPKMLHSYLETKGWSYQETWREQAAIWAIEYDGESLEILAPSSDLSYRYAVRIAEAITVLSEVEERSQLDVYYDLLGAGADVIRLRAMNSREPSQPSLDEGMTLLQHAHAILAASARFADRPGLPVYRGGISGTVKEYLQGVHAVPGYGAGYDLTLHSRVQADYLGQKEMGDAFHAPFARRATIALNAGLREAQKTAEAALSGRGASAFGNAVPKGVSANLCDAVAGLARQGAGFSVALSWASVRPADVPNGEFTFSESSADVFSDGAQWLRQSNPFTDAHVTGEIVRLDQASHEEFDGDATLIYQLDGRPIALRVRFDLSDKDEVIRAFRDGLEVSLYGDIHREGRQHRLHSPRNFTIAE